MDTPAAVTRPTDAAEDPYVWQPVGAFGPQAINARESPPPLEPETQSPVSDETSDQTWRWPDFLIGLSFGAVTVAALSLLVNFNRR